ILEGRAKTVEAAINELRPVLIGADPTRIEHLWQTMYCTTFYRGGPILTSCISGIEQALWDIKGKALGVPVYELLGGRCRDKIRMYSHSGGATPEQAAANAKKRVEQGFDAIKISPDAPVEHIDKLSYVDAFAEKFCAIREAVGKDVDIAVDFHGRIMAGMASRLIDAIEPYYPMFVEEPVLPENVEVMASIAAKTSVPIATGERLFTKWAFRTVLEQHAAAVLQPDTCHCGGIFEVKKIAAMAEMYYASVSPHNPLGPISLAACLQADTCIPNFLIQEHPGMADGLDRGVGYLKKPFEIKDGYVDAPRGTGLCIEVDEDYVRSHTFEGDWDTPRLFHADGSVAQW
ncbi:MAG: galactonate dehydratase, partial [Clostridia bacterium]|nr:galactonate dehydratase [Clostridia bacterium]